MMKYYFRNENRLRTNISITSRMTRHVRIFLIALMITFQSCNELFDYSPYAISFNEENKNVHQRNITRLIYDNNDTITIAFTGDSHRFYDELDLFVRKVNKDHSIDFVIHVGDLADFGMPKQYIWGNAYLSKLRIPYFVVIGNHDLVANGGSAYQEMFGPLNFSFIYDSIKFVFVNTNSREYNFTNNIPDVNWLDKQLRPQPGFSKVIVIFHVPPMNADFNRDLEQEFHETLARYNNVLFCVHGHIHDFDMYEPYNDNITYFNVYGVEHKKFNKITITNFQFDIQTVTL